MSDPSRPSWSTSPQLAVNDSASSARAFLIWHPHSIPTHHAHAPPSPHQHYTTCTPKYNYRTSKYKNMNTKGRVQGGAWGGARWWPRPQMSRPAGWPTCEPTLASQPANEPASLASRPNWQPGDHKITAESEANGLKYDTVSLRRVRGHPASPPEHSNPSVHYPLAFGTKPEQFRAKHES